MKARTNHNGYKRISLKCVTKNKGGTKAMLVHVCVLLAFKGRKPSVSHQGDHLNGIRDDNRDENLTWATPKENSARKKLHGTDSVGSRHPMSKLTESDIPIVFERCAKGETARSIARSYSMTGEAISMVINRKHWLHVEIEKDLIEKARDTLTSHIGIRWVDRVRGENGRFVG